VFFTRPISGTVMAVAVATIVYPVLRQWQRRRRLAAT
jgi:TctA family transporter